MDRQGVVVFLLVAAFLAIMFVYGRQVSVQRAARCQVCVNSANGCPLPPPLPFGK